MSGEKKTGYETGHDPVNHPSYYCDGGIETIDFIEAKNLCYHLASAVKYISRAGKKNPETEIQDLEKAAWYINRRIDQLKKEKDDEDDPFAEVGL